MAESAHSVYLVKGSDQSLVDQAGTRKIIDELVGDASRDLALQEMAEDDSPEAIVDACQTPSFLTERRVVVVRNAGRFKADEVIGLISYLQSPMPSASLVFVSGGGALPTRLQKAIKETGHVVDVGAPIGKRRQSWVQEQMKTAPFRLDHSATELIVDRLGDELGQLDGLIDALGSAYEEGAHLSSNDVEPFLGAGGSAAPWELTDSIDSGNTAVALEQLKRMLEGGQRHPLVVMATLQKHVTTLLRLDGSGLASEAEAATLLAPR